MVVFIKHIILVEKCIGSMVSLKMTESSLSRCYRFGIASSLYGRLGQTAMSNKRVIAMQLSCIVCKLLKSSILIQQHT